MQKNRQRGAQGYDTGFGINFKQKTKRIINKDGSFNVIKEGARFTLGDAYLFFIDMSWGAFLASILTGYLIVNALFALVYFSLGVESLSFIPKETAGQRYLEAFFFSTQTFTTVGYGAISPVSKAASLIASLEAFIGFLSFSLATGLLFGRFSRPNAKIRFSKDALIQEAEGKRSIVFRIINERPNQMMEMSATVILNLNKAAEAGISKSYTALQLQIDHIQFFPLNWTIVHPIDEHSPFHQMTNEQIKQTDGELLVHIKGYDEMFAQEVHRRFSYHLAEVVSDAHFDRVFDTLENGDILLDIDRIDDYKKDI